MKKIVCLLGVAFLSSCVRSGPDYSKQIEDLTSKYTTLQKQYTSDVSSLQGKIDTLEATINSNQYEGLSDYLDASDAIVFYDTNNSFPVLNEPYSQEMLDLYFKKLVSDFPKEGFVQVKFRFSKNETIWKIYGKERLYNALLDRLQSPGK